MTLGNLEIVPQKGADLTISASVEYNAIAIHRSELMFVSAVGSSADFKVIQSVVNSKGSIPALWAASGLSVMRPSQFKDDTGYPRGPGRMNVSPLGYNVFKHRLGFGQEHRLFVTRTPGFMLVATEEAIWRELKSEQFETPLVREWLPYVAQQLRAKSFLVECKVHPYEEADDSSSPMLSCAVINATTADVDAIVLEGLRNKSIAIPTGGGSTTNDEEPAG